MSKTIDRFSYSGLTLFEKCAYAAKLKYIDKVPEPERPLPKGKTEHANERGTRVHEGIELYVNGTNPTMPKEAAKHFKAEIESLRRQFLEGHVTLEGEWGFDRDWKPVDYKKAWLRMKCDAVVHLSKTHIVVIDFKTGTLFGNEVKHAEQVQLYALAAAIRFPEATHIDVELWYLDKDELKNEEKTAKKWLYHLKLFDARGRAMTSETTFKPNPNKYSCQYCPYREELCPHVYKDTFLSGPRKPITFIRRK